MPDPLAPPPSARACSTCSARPAPLADGEAVAAAVKAAEADDVQVVPVAMLGPQGRPRPSWPWAPTCGGCGGSRPSSSGAGLEVVDSYVSLTELSEYAQGVPEEMRQARLHPQLPPEGKAAFCFYPMSKRRGDVQQLVHAALRRPQGADVRARRERPEVRRPRAAGDHRLHRPRRLRVGRHALRRAPRRPQGGRLHDALRRGVGPLRRVRARSTPGMVAPLGEVLAAVGLD